jgi:hypothetical protein
LAAAATSGASPPDDLESLVQRASEARAKADLETALDLLERARAIRDLPEIENNIGRVLQDLGRFQDAIEAYRKVAEDPRTGADLRELDQKRIVELKKKLDSAWIHIRVVPENAELLLRGGHVDSLLAGDTGLVSAQQGEASIQATRPGGTAILLVFRKLELGRLVRVTLDVSEGRHDALTAIDLTTDLAAPIEALSVDRTKVQGRLDAQPLELLLEPGAHELEVKLKGFARDSISIYAEPAQTLLLATRLHAERIAPQQEAAITVERKKEEGAPVPKMWPLLTGAVGAALIAGGGLLVLSASSDRNRVTNAAKDGDVVIGLTMREAADLNSTANQKATFAVASFLIGALVLAGSLGWVLFGPTSAE